MYLSRLFINNYRSIKCLNLYFSKGKNIIIGRNNTGKSNIIKAIDVVLGENSPTYQKGENITANDFYSWTEVGNSKEKETLSAKEIFIWCELERDEEEALNYEEINKCYGYYVFSEILEWLPNGKPIKGPIRISKEDLPKNYKKIFDLEEDISDKEYVSSKPKSIQTFRKQLNDKFSFAFAFKAMKDDNDNIIKDIRFLYRPDSNSDWIIGSRATVRNELLQSAIIPSFRDPQNQMRLTKWNWYGKLMHHLTSEHESSKKLINALGEVKSIGDEIFEDVKQKVEASSLDVAFPGTRLNFRFNTTKRSDLYKNCVIYVDDGVDSQLIDKGSGIQSATIIGLFNYYTQYVNTKTSALLCVEEPELYLHPHACRVISDRLDDFLSKDKNQVIITTHSVEFIRSTFEDLNIILARKGNDGTYAFSVKIKNFKKFLIDRNQNELFFADKVIVCEGYDSSILFAAARDIFPKKLDENNISVISAGGKDKISQMVSIILKLGIKCFVMADFDYLLRDTLKERNTYGKKAHESIENLGKNFFTKEYIFGERGTLKLSELQKLRNRIKQEDEKAFYKAKKINDINHPDLPETLSDLRKNGVCILAGEIESLCKDTSFLSTGSKLDLDKIYDLNSRLANGTKITEIFETKELEEFLRVVLER